MYDLSVNLEIIYADQSEDLAARAAMAAEDGFAHAELWTLSTRDRTQVKAALDGAGLSLVTMLGEPRTSLSTATELAPFYEGLKASAETANYLGCPYLVISSGVATPKMKRQPQHERAIEVLHGAVEAVAGSGVTILLEAVNTRVDHPGALIDRAEDSVALARAVGAADLAVVFDLYHALAMGEDVAAILSAGSDLVRHVQVAGCPGRHEPQNNDVVNWPRMLGLLKDAGYEGLVGLEYFPAEDSRSSVRTARAALHAAG